MVFDLGCLIPLACLSGKLPVKELRVVEKSGTLDAL